MTTGTFILPDGRGDKTKILLTPLGAGMIIGKGGATIKQIKVRYIYIMSYLLRLAQRKIEENIRIFSY